MTVQDDKAAGQGDDRKATDENEQPDKDEQQSSGDDDRKLTEKPEPDEDDKKEAAKMMEAYEDKPTIVLPGSAGMVSGTAVNDWLDEDGNPRNEPVNDGGSGDKAEGSEGNEGRSEEEMKAQIEKDKALNEELRKAAAAENKGEND
ncbi:MAG: hypothetical protein ACXVX4_09145 [Mycobacterium sp.]